MTEYICVVCQYPIAYADDVCEGKYSRQPKQFHHGRSPCCTTVKEWEALEQVVPASD